MHLFLIRSSKIISTANHVNMYINLIQYLYTYLKAIILLLDIYLEAHFTLQTMCNIKAIIKTWKYYSITVLFVLVFTCICQYSHILIL